MDLMAARRAVIGATCGIAYEGWNLSFNRSNYIDTGIYLFTEENINKDFEVEITNLYGSAKNNEETIVCAKHNGNAYGFLIRLNGKTTNYTGTINMSKNYNNHIIIKRVNGIISVTGKKFVDESSIRFTNEVHQWPLILGCAINDDGSLYRFAQGTIGHIIVRWI